MTDDDKRLDVLVLSAEDIVGGGPELTDTLFKELAQARLDLARVEIHYRNWRATQTAELLERTKGLAEWKIKAAIESDEKWMEFKDAAGRTQYTVDLLEGALEVVKMYGGDKRGD